MSASKMSEIHKQSSHLFYVCAGALCVWMSLGCIVLEEGGEELDSPSMREESPDDRRDGRRDEFEDFEDLDPGAPTPIEPDAPDMSPPDVDMPAVQPPAGDFELTGRITQGPEQGGELVVLWYVNTRETPYFYKYGDGGLSPDGDWSLTIPGGDLPEDALNVDGVGMALVMGLKQWTGRMEDGRLSRDEFRAMEQAAFGLSRDHALIYLGEDARPLTTRDWAEDFERGAVTCAVGRSDAPRGVAAMNCEAFEIVVTREFSWLMF